MNKETDNNYYCFVSKYLQLCEYIVKLKEFKKRRRTMKSNMKKAAALLLAGSMVAATAVPAAAEFTEFWCYNYKKHNLEFYKVDSSDSYK